MSFFRMGRSFAAVTVTVMTLMGTACGSSNTDIVYMATWCPYSNQLKSFLADKRIRKYTATRNIVFVFSNNEWPTVKERLEDAAKSGEFKRGEIPDILEALKVRAGGAGVMDPSVLKDLPGSYRLDDDLPPQVTSFPAVNSQGEWIDRSDWLFKTLKIPGKLGMAVLNQYEPD